MIKCARESAQPERYTRLRRAIADGPQLWAVQIGETK